MELPPTVTTKSISPTARTDSISLSRLKVNESTNYSVRLNSERIVFPCGIQLSEDEKTVYVCLSKKNSIAVVDLEGGKIVQQIEVGVAPFAIARTDNHLFVSNTGGRRAKKDDQTALSAGTPTVVDKRGVAMTGSVSVISINQEMKVVNEIAVGRQPSVLVGQADKIIVCNTNDDSVSVLNRQNVLHSIETRPDEKLPFGSMPGSVLVDKDLMLVALSGNNAVAVYEDDQKPRLIGLIPTGWYPAALAANEKYLFIANIKGEGARAKKRKASEGMNSHDHLGSIQRVELAKLKVEGQLENWTATVKKKRPHWTDTSCNRKSGSESRYQAGACAQKTRTSKRFQTCNLCHQRESYV